MADLRHEPHPNWRPLYPPISCSLGLAVRLGYRLRVDGLDRVPRSGGLLVVSNHASDLDPLVLVGIFPRPVTFMAKAELFRRWYARVAARWSQTAFPVRRGTMDVSAVRDALSYLQQGAALVMFPEGTRRPHGLGPGLPGAGYLAARANCPVLPVGISGTAHALSLQGIAKRTQIAVRIGDAFDVDRTTPPAQLADDIMARVAILLPEGQRGVYSTAEGAGSPT